LTTRIFLLFFILHLILLSIFTLCLIYKHHQC
jgi:hypothetical protein